MSCSNTGLEHTSNNPPAGAEKCESRNDAISDIVKVIEQMNDRVVQLDLKGDYSSALALAQEALVQTQRKLLAAHPLQLTCRLNLAAVYLKLDRQHELQQVVREAIAVEESIQVPIESTTEPFSPETLSSFRADVHRLMLLAQQSAIWCEAATDYQGAKDLWEKITGYRSRLLGSRHWQVIDAQLEAERLGVLVALPQSDRVRLRRALRLNNRVVSLFAQGKYRKAYYLLKRAWHTAGSIVSARAFFHVNFFYNLAVVFQANGQRITADRYFRRSRKLYKSYLGYCHPKYASALRQHAELVRQLGRYPEARKLLVCALRIIATTLGKQHPDYALCLNDLAVHYHWAADYKRAKQYYLRALAVYEALAKPSRDYFDLLINLSGLYLRQQDYDRAETLARQALEMARQFGEDTMAFALGLSSLAEVYNERGDHKQNQTLLRQAISLLEKLNGIEHLSLVSILGNLALSLRATGDYRSSEEYLRRALAILRVHLPPEHLDNASILERLGDHYYLIRDFEQAARYYQDVLAIQRHVLGEKHPWVAKTWDNVGSLYAEQQDYNRALECLQRAAQIRQEQLGEEHRDYAQSLNHLGLLYEKIGDYVRAEDHLKRALAIRKRILGEGHDDYATSLNNLAYFYQQNGRVEQALDLYQQALTIYQETLGMDHPHVALCLSNLALLYADRHDWQSAIDLLQQALEIDKQTTRHVLLISSERQRLEYLQRSRANVAACLSLVQQTSGGEPQLVTAAFNILLQRKGLAAEVFSVQRDTVLRGRYPHLAGQLNELRTLRLQIAQETMAGPRNEGLRSHKERLRVLHAEQEELEAALIRQIPEADVQHQLERANVQSLTSSLAIGDALIEFVKTIIFPLGTGLRSGDPEAPLERYLAFVVTANAPEQVMFKDLGEAAPIDNLIRDFRQAIGGSTNRKGAKRHLRIGAKRSAQPKMVAIRKLLRQAIFDPLTPLLSNCQRVFLAPDGDLSILPFETLATDTGHSLIDHYTFSYLAVGRELLRFRTPQLSEVDDCIVIADPDFDLTVSSTPEPTIAPPTDQLLPEMFEGYDFIRLPGTYNEGVKVANQLGVNPWIGANATKQRLIGVHSPPILHLATHGFAIPSSQAGARRHPGSPQIEQEQFPPNYLENPLLRSGLALAGANTWLRGRALPETTGNGILTAEDASGLDLLDTELVVLSACETGLGDIQIGEGVLGLRRAFMLAGAKTLVMSLWKVPDQQTQELIVDFYQRLLTGTSRVEALREAQLAMKQRYIDPVYWGGFILQGDPGRLTFTSQAKRKTCISSA